MMICAVGWQVIGIDLSWGLELILCMRNRETQEMEDELLLGDSRLRATDLTMGEERPARRLVRV